MPTAPTRFIRLLALISLLLALFSLGFTMWVHLPAISFGTCVLGLVAGESSFRFLFLGLLAAALGFVALRGGRRRTGLAAIFGGLIAASLTVQPWTEARAVSRATSLPLSLREALFGFASLPAVDERRGVAFAGEGATARLLDAYLPRDKDLHAAVVMVHGGSWEHGERSETAPWDRYFASEGYAVFDVDYRLDPSPNWREAIADVKCAVAWVRAHAPEYGVDPARIALAGRSAGGHLALAAGYGGANSQLPSACPGDSRVQAVVAFSAPTDLAWDYAHPANPQVLDTPAALRHLLGGTPEQQPIPYRLASPITLVNAEMPPTLLVQGGRDQIVRAANADRLEDRLAVVRAPHEALRLPWADHGFEVVDGGWGAQLSREAMRRFLGRTLAPK
jgi:acetyl esterase/lipase